MKEITSSILPETKRIFERHIGLTFEQMDNMDLGEIEQYIQNKGGVPTTHSPEIYRKSRDVLTARGKFLTAESLGMDMQRLIRKYAN
ncbi:MAG: hypothetical protein V1886_01775 [archaeon]